MKYTPEQQAVIDAVHTNEGLYLVKAVAGAGKTTLLTGIATMPHTNGLYLAYNKAIATSSQSRFPSTTKCVTTHSLAYQATVKANQLRVGTFTYRDIKDRIKYEQKFTVINLLREFCLSAFTDYPAFADTQHEDDQALTPVVMKYLSQMQSGAINCTHEFYLKLFHIQLANEDITYEPFDFILLDEAGDLNEVTLAIFQLLPSTRKIVVGDPHQNIYSFNHTINCFTLLEGQGTLFTLPQSFRVPDHIARRIDAFCKSYLDKDIVFRGIPAPTTTPVTRAYITRTNSALIGKMVELNNERTPYGLVRKASDIFRLPLMLCSMKYQHFISDPTYKFLQADYDEWYEDPNLQRDFKSPFSYFLSLYDEDIQLVNALKVVLQFSPKIIFKTYYEAKKHENSPQNFTLLTAHSSKGLEFDEVIIAEDLNSSIATIIDYLKVNPDATLSIPNRESLNLYYVACSRALNRLSNAAYL